MVPTPCDTMNVMQFYFMASSSYFILSYLALNIPTENYGHSKSNGENTSNGFDNGCHHDKAKRNNNNNNKKYRISRKCGVKQIESQTQIDITIFDSFTVICSAIRICIGCVRHRLFASFIKSVEQKKRTDCQTKNLK